MKRMIVSDIHGSYPALQSVMHLFMTLQCEQLILLGDLLYHGPRNDLPDGYDPKKCIALFNDHKTKIIAVRGNCDSEVDQMVLSFPIMSDYALLNNNTQTIFITHGHVYNEQSMPSLQRGDVLMSGHTHIPVMKELNGIHFLNPGSVSIPKEGSQPSVGLLEGKQFQLLSLTGESLATYHCAS